MCSSCLTPVYPVEKIVVNEMVLHFKCFCCKHCRKKLSIHNYSSIHGELYCITHYQQLLKRKGNNDEGFGQSFGLPKNKGESEPDARFTPKMTKNNINIIKSERSKETSLEKLAVRSPTRETGHKSAADARGKLKMSWPPEKKKAGVTQTHTTTINTKRGEADRTAFSVRSRSEEGRVDKLDSKRETQEKTSNMNKVEQSRTESFDSAEMMPSKKTFTNTNSVEKVNSLTSMVGQMSLNYYDTDNYVKSQRMQMKIQTPIPKRENNPATKQMDNPQNNIRKRVRFSSQIDVTQYDQFSELNSTTEEVIKFRERIADDHSTSEVSTGETGSSLKTAGDEYQQDETDNAVQNQECPQTFQPSNENKESVSKLSNSQGNLNVLLNESINEKELENSIIVSNLADCEVVQEANIQIRESQFENPQTDSNDHMTPAVKPNSPKGSPKQNHKPRGKLGSWPKGRSTLSKLFTSSGNDKANKPELKDSKKSDIKPGSGILGRLFQSSTEKNDDVQKVTAQVDNNDQTYDEDLRKVKEGEVAKKIRMDGVFEEETKAQKLKNLNDRCRATETHTSQDENSDQTQDEDLRKVKEGEVAKEMRKDDVYEEETKAQNLKKDSFDENTLSDRCGPTKTHTSQDENNDQTQDEDLKKVREGEVSKEIQDVVYEEETKAQKHKKDSFDENTLSDSCGVTATHTSSETDLPAKHEKNTNADILSTDTEDSSLCEDASDLKDFPSGGQIGHQNWPGQSGDMNAPSSDSTLEVTREIIQHLSNGYDPSLVVSGNPFEQNEVLDEVNEEATTQPSETHFEPTNRSTEDSSSCLVLSDTSLELSQIDATSLAAEPTQGLNLIDTQSITSDMTFNISDQQHSLLDSAPLSETHTEREQVIDLDIFSMNNDMFAPPPFDSVPDHGGFAFPDDIFAVGDISSDAGGLLLLPSSSASSNTLNDPPGSDASPAAASSATMDIFTDDILSAETTWVPNGTNNAFMDSFLMSTSNEPGHKSEDGNTGSSWMDDLLG